MTTARSNQPKPKSPAPVRLLPALEPVTVTMVASARLNGTAVDARLTNAVVTVERERTMLRASLLTLSVADPDAQLLRSPILQNRIDLDLRDAGGERWVYDLARSIGGYSYQNGTIAIRLWDLETATLKSINGARVWSGEKTSLDALVTSLCGEANKQVHGLGLKSVVPDPGQLLSPAAPVVQRVLKRADGTTTPVGTTTAGRGFPAGAAAKVRVKHSEKANASQISAIEAILTEAERLGASPRVQIACIMCATQESDIQNLRHGDNRRSDTVGYFQQGPEWLKPEFTNDPAKGCRAFLLGHAAGLGGTDSSKKGWKQHFGSLRQATGDLGAMIFTVQRGGAGAGDWYANAKRTVELWHGGTGDEKIARPSAGGSTSASTTETTRTLKRLHRPTEWRRGTANRPESSWTMLDRYAQSFGRRRFVSADRVVVADDDQLILAAPHMTFAIDDANIIDRPSIDVDGPGGLETLQLTALSSWWTAPPGGVVDVQGGGPADGPWLVATLRDQAGVPTVQVELTQPATEDPDKQTQKIKTTTIGSAGTAGTDASGDASTASGAVYQASIRISQATPGYSYGGGHGAQLQESLKNKRLDCSSSSSLALKLGGLFKGTTAIVSGDFARSWGVAGEGEHITVWANVGHVFIEFKGLGKYRRLDTGGRGGGNGPKVHEEMRSTAGFTARHWPGT